MPGFVLIAGLIKVLPNRFDELVLLMRTGLASDNEDLARNAVRGLHDWAMIAAKAGSQLPPPPDDLIREIGIIIATRRKVSLEPSLQIAKWVFDEGNDAQKKAVRDLVLQGLGYLAEELRYDREENDPHEDVPLLRWRSAQLDGSTWPPRRSGCCPLVGDCRERPATRDPVCETSCYHP